MLMQNFASLEAAGRTAISRPCLSKPARLAIECAVFSEEDWVLDYGCGRGHDVLHLKGMGYCVTGYDPNRPRYAARPTGPDHVFDVVMLNYVLNVIDDPDVRVEVLRDAWRLAGKCLLVAVRVDRPAKGARREGDGWRTKSGTFQHHYTQAEAIEYITTVLGAAEIEVLGQGVFLIVNGRA